MKKVIIILIILAGVGVWYFYFKSDNNIVFSEGALEEFKYYKGVDVCTYKGQQVIFSDQVTTDSSGKYLYDMNGNELGHNASLMGTKSEAGDIDFSLVQDCVYREFNR